MRDTTYGWEDWDFRPAPAGWRVVYLEDEDEPGWMSEPMPGWLVQYEYEFSRRSFESVDERPLTERPRRIVAAVIEDYWLSAADTVSNFWMVLGPGAPDPTAEQARAEREQRAERKRRAERAAIRAAAPVS